VKQFPQACLLASSLALGCAPRPNPAASPLRSDWKWLRPEASVEPREPERARLLDQYRSVLEGTISAAHAGGYEAPYPELLELVARIDRLDANVLRTTRDLLRRQILASPAFSLEECRIFVAICNQLKDADTVVSTLQMLPATEASASVRANILNHALGDFYDRRLYAELVRNSDVLWGRIRTLRHIEDQTPGATIETAAVLYEAFLAQEDLRHAREIANWAVSFRQDHNTYVALMKSAHRVGLESESERLSVEAHQVLTADEKAKFDQAATGSR
jgi:hypothetical protein